MIEKFSQKNTKQNLVRGFTIIETIIYISLFSLVIGGMIIAVYSIIGSQEKNILHSLLLQEGNYITKKINWAIVGGTEFNVVSSNELNIYNKNVSSSDNPIIFKFIDNNLYLYRGADDLDVLPLNNTNIKITNGSFIYSSSSSGHNGLENIQAVFTLSGKMTNGLDYSRDFRLIKYLKK